MLSLQATRWIGSAGVLTALLLDATPALPWGCDGHQAVALIAQAHLKTPARSKVKAILASHPIDPHLHRFCKSTGLDPIADAATWADDVRGVLPATAGWHFLDIPRGAPDAPLSNFCPAAGCVTTAIENQVDVLKNPHAKSKDRAQALMFVIHFAGDIHQPLHCATNNDRGGNCVPVDYFGTHTHQVIDAHHPAKDEDFSPNLHAVWDTDIIKHAMGHASVKTYAAQLDQRFQAQDAAWESAGINVEQWARESHKPAEDVAYGKLGTADPVESPEPPIKHCNEDNDVAKRMLALHEAVDQKYQDAAQPVVEEQLAKAGVRLAMILNDVWK